MAYSMTAAQAARRLGVKQATLYAYVSRGVLGRGRAADGRGSLFDPDEIEQLARRGRPAAIFSHSVHEPPLDFAFSTGAASIEPKLEDSVIEPRVTITESSLFTSISSACPWCLHTIPPTKRSFPS